ncbi:GNAT family N-acetyltransferase [Cellulomonas biazotea]|jgi:GNAT superfamily N-acetyltransferase|uniref:N-acetyltransferase domain-containing protein n=1 Tax=Cellulomonas biazotea TaxID=1709 RepID=A0A402DSU6_9CELL|nr:GNAT family N-acetyltransferase [Cellulomonas biazotea]GCE77194.1 hypothetical protein CBZ_22500 [Cellulomonas biazotea]
MTQADAPTVEVDVVGWDDPDVVRLRDAQQAELRERYGEDDIGHEMTGDDIVAVVRVRVDGEAVAIGALRDLDEDAAYDDVSPGTGEIKRMYVEPAHRGRGYSRLVLTELERLATARDWRVLLLETGPLQPDAIGLYLRAGYFPVENYGEYVGVVDSRCFAKWLVPVPGAPRQERATGRVELVRVPWQDPRAVALRRAMHEFNCQRYPELIPVFDAAGGFDGDDAQQGVGVVTATLALLDGEPVGHVALRAARDGYPDGSGEVKKLYVDGVARGAGVGRVLMEAVEADAREAGMSSLLLQTGVRQPEAVALYVSLGYRPVVPFGPYAGDLLSLCFGKAL